MKEYKKEEIEEASLFCPANLLIVNAEVLLNLSDPFLSLWPFHYGRWHPFPPLWVVPITLFLSKITFNSNFTSTLFSFPKRKSPPPSLSLVHMYKYTF
jgi:hypothetical protein